MREHRPIERRLKKGVYILPNALTLCGMLCGFFSILSSIDGVFVYAAWAIIIANIFDALDGWIARLTNTATRFGIELDSLSDLVAFGVAPAVMMYKWALVPFGRVGWAVAFLFVACGALRLARFNVQTGSSNSKAFKGLPIPAAATVLASLVIFYHQFSPSLPDKNIMLLILTAIVALLMVSTFRYHGLKEIDFKERKPFSMLLLFVLVLFVLFIYPYAVFIFVMAYLIWGIIENIYLFFRNRKIRREHQNAAGQPETRHESQ
ncbi:MAG: CDP-diacylglycerol--serine O-phosphatidyltransferase [Nitrospiraceae bacterium]|nr:CDP-diacylglycerol--serine O-phosphatidyltransferase [Nitrospiraceae bacterium]